MENQTRKNNKHEEKKSRMKIFTGFCELGKHPIPMAEMKSKNNNRDRL